METGKYNESNYAAGKTSTFIVKISEKENKQKYFHIFRIIKKSELDGTHMVHGVHLLALHKTTPKSNDTSECVVHGILGTGIAA